MYSHNRSSKKVILTFDVENELFKDSQWLEEIINKILGLLDKYERSATFFTVGQIAEQMPGMIRKIVKQGHELALHGAFSHITLDKISKERFKEGLEKTISIFKKITGEKVIGFRAPWFSLTEQTKWILPILEENGLKYDSSICPVNMFYYGVNNAPMNMYQISMDCIKKSDDQSAMLEIPVSVYSIGGIRIPTGGGIYFTVIPFRIFEHVLKHILKDRIPVIYFHPHDLSRGKHLKKTFRNIIMHPLRIYGSKNNMRKFEMLLKKYECISVENFLSL